MGLKYYYDTLEIKNEPVIGKRKSEQQQPDGLVETFLIQLGALLDAALLIVRKTDRTMAIATFIGFLFIAFGLLIFFYGHWSGKSQRRRVRRAKAFDQAVEGKRSARLRLRNHELVFIERITPEEFDR